MEDKKEALQFEVKKVDPRTSIYACWNTSNSKSYDTR